MIFTDSFTLMVSYCRHTGFILILLMLTRLKFSSLVLPTVSSWVIIQIHPFLVTISVLFERNWWVGQYIRNNKRQLKGSSFSGVVSCLLADLQSCSYTANVLDRPPRHLPFCIPTGDQTPPGMSWGVPICSRNPLSCSRGIFKIKVRNWLDQVWTLP